MTRRLIVAWLAALTASAGLAQAVSPEVEALRLPDVGAVTLGVGVSARMLEPSATEEQRRVEADGLQAKADAGTATPDEWARLGELRGGLGDQEAAAAARGKALEAYQAALQATPDDLALLTGLGKVQLATFDVTAAEETLTRVVKDHTDQIDAYPPLLKALQFQAAPYLLWLEQAQAVCPDEMSEFGSGAGGELPEAESPRTQQLRQALAAAEPVLAEGLERMLRPPTIFEVSTRREALDRSARWLGQARREYLRRIDEAPTVELYRGLIETHATVMMADFWVQQARLLAAGEDANTPHRAEAMMRALSLPGMVEVGERVSEAHPDHLGLHALLGCMHTMEAVQEFVAPIMQGLTTEMGEPNADQLAAAREHLTTALALSHEQRVGVVSALALGHYLSGELAETVKVTQAAVDRGEWEETAVNAALLALLGVSVVEMAVGEEAQIDQRIGDHPEAEQKLTAWLAKLPQPGTQPYANLARMRAATGNWAGACEALEQACERAPANAGLVCSLGIAYLKAGKTAEGRAKLDEAAVMDPGGNEALTETIATARKAAGEG